MEELQKILKKNTHMLIKFYYTISSYDKGNNYGRGEGSQGYGAYFPLRRLDEPQAKC